MKIVENLKAVDTGKRRIIDEPLYKIKYAADLSSADYITRFAREYSIVVILGANQWISEDIIRASDGHVIEEAVENMKYAIIQELYGELRRELINLQMDMRNELSYCDSPSLKKLTQIIEKITL